MKIFHINLVKLMHYLMQHFLISFLVLHFFLYHFDIFITPKRRVQFLNCSYYEKLQALIPEMQLHFLYQHNIVPEHSTFLHIIPFSLQGLYDYHVVLPFHLQIQ